MAEKAFLIDGNSFCYRAFYAIKGLRTSYGQPTGAVYGFVTMLNALIEKESPDYLAISFDLKAPTFRHKAFTDYKLHRKPMPDELIMQLPVIKEVVDAYRIPIFEKEGFEADDCLATLARSIARDEITVYIVTGDKDMLQVVNSHIKVYNIHKEGAIYDEQSVRERFKVEPMKIPDLMAFAGDSTDNIPGVKGIGERGAVELMNEFGGLNEIFSHIDSIRNKRYRYALEQHKEAAILSRELATLRFDVPLNIGLDRLRFSPKRDIAALKEIFKELEFNSLLKNLKEDKLKAQCLANFNRLSNIEDFDAFLKSALKSRKLALDIKTDIDNAMRSRVLNIEFCLKDGADIYSIDQIDSFLSPLKDLLEGESVSKIGHDMKFKKVVLKNNYGIELRGISFDTLIASYLVNSKAYERPSISELFKLETDLTKELREKDMVHLFDEIEMPLISVLADMELAGIGIDLKFLQDMSCELDKKLKTMHKDIIDIAGCDFNINSPKQLANVLYKQLKLPILKRTKTGPSTDAEVLERLAGRHILPGMLLNYRELAKLKSTYVDALPEVVSQRDRRLHTSFNQAITATGRLSSSEPNLQNIPIRSEIGRRIRKAFVATKKDWLLLSADYSQIELRILAHLSKDENLIRAFKDGLDIHKFSASLIYGVELDDVTSDMRAVGKTVNFAVIYGMSDYGLSRELNIDRDAASRFIDSYFARYPKVRQYLESQVELAHDAGYVATIFGRRRYIPDIKSDSNALKGFAERTAINTPIQGSAADMIKIAMVRIHRAIKEERLKAMMVLQIHDELIFESPECELDRIKQIVHQHMAGAVQLCVPVEVSIKIAKTWADLC